MKPKRPKVLEEKTNSRPILPVVMALANKLINELGFTERINEGIKATTNAWTVDAGRLLKALVLSTFIDMRAPLSHVSKRLSGFDIEYLLDKDGVKVEELNEFSIGRALERLGEADSDGIYEAMALEAVVKNEIPINRLHSDTTTVSFYGEYDIDKMDLTEAEKEEILKIERGYNKDGRPECKQVVVGQIVNEAGIPLTSKTMDGATSDIEWNKQALTYLDDIAGAGFSGIYVADSKLVFEEAIETMFNKEKPVQFISRMPANFEHGMEARKIKQAYREGGWEELGVCREGPQSTEYMCKSYIDKLYGNNVRLMVLESSSLKIKAWQGLEKKAEKAAIELKKLEKKEFAAEKDAKTEIDCFEKKWRCFDYGLTIEKEIQIKYPKGRRKAGCIGQEIIIYRIQRQYEALKLDACTEYLQNESCIVIISNVTEGFTDKEILQIYKGQQIVENSFQLLKEPQLASVIYLKKPERIKGLMMVLSFALLIRAIIQFKMRQGLEAYNAENKGKPPRVGWNDKPLKNPTYKLLYEQAYNCRFTRENIDTYSFYTPNEAAEMRVTILLQLMGLTIYDLLD